jgi:competence protein ComEC
MNIPENSNRNLSRKNFLRGLVGVSSFLIIPQVKTFSALSESIQNKSINAEYIFVNVGFGDTTILKLGNKTVMIDCFQENGYGESFIKHLPSKKIDLLILTHRHFDHYFGIEQILENNIQVEEVWESNYRGHLNLDSKILRPYEFENGKKAKQLIGELNKRGTIISLADTSLPPKMINGYQFSILNPLPDVNENPANAVHDACLVILMTSPENKREILFCADANSTVLDRIYRAGNIENVHILCAPHHGALDSVHPTFIERVAPQYTIVSSRPGFHKQIPEHESLAIYQKYTMEAVLKTYEKGTIFLKSE